MDLDLDGYYMILLSGNVAMGNRRTNLGFLAGKITELNREFSSKPYLMTGKFQHFGRFWPCKIYQIPMVNRPSQARVEMLWDALDQTLERPLGEDLDGDFTMKIHGTD